jgi:hypothetical protein
MEDNKSARVVAKKSKGKQNLNTFVKGLLRRGTFHWRARTEAMTLARVERGKYLCAECKDLFGPKEVILDHIEPVVDPKVGFIDFDVYIKRMYPPAEGFQVLCIACSDAKTMQEDIMREYYKKERKEKEELDKQPKVE